MESGDDWFAADKFQHLIACFLITLAVALIARRSRHHFLRRRSAALGSVAALAAGAAKEAADEIGVLWASAGGSAKDGAADALGVLLAYLFLSTFSASVAPPRPDSSIPDSGVSIV